MTKKTQTKIWALVHDKVGYQIYRQSIKNPRFYYDPNDIRWAKENMGEILAEYDNELKALIVKDEVENFEILHRQLMLEALEIYMIEKNRLDQAIRNIARQIG